MKFAIKANLSRGKEIISLLERLGGINSRDLVGDGDVGAYYIDENNIIRYNYRSIDYKVYTLEEFEKVFPFKIGDKVVCKENLHALHTIIGISYNSSSCLQYEIKEDKTGIIVHYPTDLLVKYKEMKKERNVTLTLDKAKEWYKKGGELKEVALQAFSEKELNPLPRSWEEFCEKYPIKTSEAVICTESTIVTCDSSEIRDSDCDREVCPSIKSAEAHLAMIQLEQLRDCWRQGWKPDWNDDQQSKYCVLCFHEEFKISTLYETKHFLSFPTKEMAKEFLECFRDLIKKAGDLI